MPPNLTNEKSTLVHVMAWCRQATITWANVGPDLGDQIALIGHIF